MIQQLFDEHLSAMTTQIKEKYPSEIESFAQRLMSLGLKETQVDEDIRHVVQSLIMHYNQVSDEEFFYVLNLFPDYHQFGNQVIEFKITLKGIKSWRKVRLPALFTLTEMAYAAIAAFKGSGGHWFTIKTQDRRYTPFKVDLEDYEDSNHVLLGHLGLREKAKIHIDYDFGEGWDFECVVTRIKTVGDSLPQPELIGGKGYDLWEDNRGYLELLIQDPKAKVQDWKGHYRQVGKIAEEEGITQFDKEDCDAFPLEMDILREFYQEMQEV